MDEVWFCIGSASAMDLRFDYEKRYHWEIQLTLTYQIRHLGVVGSTKLDMPTILVTKSRLTLTRSDINFDHGLVSLRTTKTKTGEPA